MKCPRQYYKKYVLKIKDPPNQWAMFGLLCHDTLEAYCKNSWNNRSLMLQHFRSQVMAKDIPPYMKNKFISDGYKIFVGFPIHEIIHNHTVGVEEKIELALSDDVNFIAYIDRVAATKSNLQIIDYKSNQKPAPEKYMLQLKLYDMGTAIKYPEYKKRYTHLHWIRHNKIDTFSFEPDSWKKTQDWLVAMAKKIQALEDTGLEANFPKIKNDNCKYCMFSKECWG